MTNPPQEFFPNSPITGMLNPIAPPVRVWVVDGADGGYREIRGEAYFDYPYEGPPTCVHGGVIAETFDEMLGAANMVADNAGHDRDPDHPLPQADPAPDRSPHRGPLPRAHRAQGPDLGRDLQRRRADGRGRGDLHRGRPDRMVAIAEANPDSADPVMLAAMRAEAAAVAASMPASYAREGERPDVRRRPGTAGPLPGGGERRTALPAGQIFSRPSQ